MLTTKDLLLLMILVSFLLCACGGNRNSTSTRSGQFEFIVIDSVTIDRLSEVKLLDYQENNQELLLEDRQTNEILVVNRQGEVISNFKPYIEGPDHVGNESYGWCFYGEDELISYGSVHFHRLTKAGKRLQRLPYPVEVRGWVMRDYDPEMILPIDKGSKAGFLAIIPGVATRFRRRTQAYQDSVHVAYAIDFDGDRHRAIFPKPTSSVYRTLGAYVDSGLPTISHWKDKRFAVSYAIDSKVYLYDAVDNRLLKSLDIPEAHRPVFKAVPFGSDDKPEKLKLNARLFSTGSLLLLEVAGQIPREIMRQIQQVPQWWESEELKAAYRQYGTSDYLVFDEGGFLGEASADIGGISYSIVSTQNDFFWVQRTYEDERDYQTFLKVAVKPVKSE